MSRYFAFHLCSFYYANTAACAPKVAAANRDRALYRPGPDTTCSADGDAQPRYQATRCRSGLGGARAAVTLSRVRIV
jgi:hypothetical protein